MSLMDLVTKIFEHINTPIVAAIMLTIFGYIWFNPKLKKISMIQKILIGTNSNLQTILAVLGREGILKSNDFSELSKTNKDIIESLLREEELKLNPMTKDEIHELRQYYQQVNDGHTLSLEQARRFNYLVERLKHDRPDHTGTWVLAGLAGLALGLALGIIIGSTRNE